MPDWEKLIKGLETCSQKTVLYVCGQCPYNNDDNDTYDCTQALAEDALDMLKEHDAVEKNKECHEDKIAVECLNAIQTVNKYIDEEEDECGCTYWKDKKGYAFQADTGYFFEGLDNFEAYLIKRLRKAVK